MPAGRFWASFVVDDPRYTAVLFSVGVCFFRFVGLFVLAGFFVGWLVRLCLRWFRVCFQRLVVLDFVLLVVWERCSGLLVAVSVRKPKRDGFKKPRKGRLQ